MNKRIKFYLMDKDNPLEVFKDHNNHIFIYEKGEVFFNLLHGPWEDVEISHVTLSLNEQLSPYLFSVYMIGLENAKKLCDEPIIYSENQLNKVRAAIDSTINLYMLREDQQLPNSIWDFLTDIFIKLLMFHCLENGNKRTAFSFLMAVVSRCGYYFSFKKENNISDYENVIANFVKELGQNTHNDEKELEIKSKIRKWIINNTLVSQALLEKNELLNNSSSIKLINGNKGFFDWTKKQETKLDNFAFFNEQEGQEIKRVFTALAKM